MVRQVARPDVFGDFQDGLFDKIVVGFNTDAIGAAPALGDRVLTERGAGEAHVTLALHAALELGICIAAADAGTGVIFWPPIILP